MLLGDGPPGDGGALEYTCQPGPMSTCTVAVTTSPGRATDGVAVAVKWTGLGVAATLNEADINISPATHRYIRHIDLRDSYIYLIVTDVWSGTVLGGKQTAVLQA